MGTVFGEDQVEDLERCPEPALRLIARSLGSLCPAAHTLGIGDAGHVADELLAEDLLEEASDVLHLKNDRLLVSLSRRRSHRLRHVDPLLSTMPPIITPSTTPLKPPITLPPNDR